MDGERKINLSEGVPLNSPGAANIFLNTGNGANTKVNSPNGTVIHLKAGTSFVIQLHAFCPLHLFLQDKLTEQFYLFFRQ